MLDAKRELRALGWLWTKSTSCKLQATSYKPQATGHGLLFCLPLWGRWPKAGGGWLSRKWGCGLWSVVDGVLLAIAIQHVMR